MKTPTKQLLDAADQALASGRVLGLFADLMHSGWTINRIDNRAYDGYTDEANIRIPIGDPDAPVVVSRDATATTPGWSVTISADAPVPVILDIADMAQHYGRSALPVDPDASS